MLKINDVVFNNDFHSLKFGVWESITEKNSLGNPKLSGSVNGVKAVSLKAKIAKRCSYIFINGIRGLKRKPLFVYFGV